MTFRRSIFRICSDWQDFRRSTISSFRIWGDVFRRSVILPLCHSTVPAFRVARYKTLCVPADLDHKSVTHVTTYTLVNMATEHEDPAVTVFREYLKIKTVQPNPDYGKYSLD